MMLDDRHIGADGGPAHYTRTEAEPRSWLFRTILFAALIGMVLFGFLLAWSVDQVVPVLVGMADALR